MRNQYMAKVLVHNKVVSEAQVKAHWGEITDKKDIGQVLVDAGILPPPMYIKVLAFVKNLEAKAAAEGGAAAPAAAPASAASAAPQKQSTARFEAPPASAPSVAPAQPAPSEGLQIEGNSSLYGEVSTSNVEVEAVAGLESTSISTVQVQAEAEEESSVMKVLLLPESLFGRLDDAAVLFYQDCLKKKQTLLRMLASAYGYPLPDKSFLSIFVVLKCVLTCFE